MLESLPEDRDEATKVLEFLARALSQSRSDLAADAELLALEPAFDEVFAQWRKRHEAWEARKPQRAAFEARFVAEVERRTGLTWADRLGYCGSAHESGRGQAAILGINWSRFG